MIDVDEDVEVRITDQDGNEVDLDALINQLPADFIERMFEHARAEMEHKAMIHALYLGYGEARSDAWREQAGRYVKQGAALFGAYLDGGDEGDN